MFYLSSFSDPYRAAPFTSFSVVVGRMIKELHRRLLLLLNSFDVSVFIATQSLKCLAALMSNVPYQKLQPGLITRTVKQIRPFLAHRGLTCLFKRKGSCITWEGRRGVTGFCATTVQSASFMTTALLSSSSPIYLFSQFLFPRRLTARLACECPGNLTQFAILHPLPYFGTHNFLLYVKST